MEKIFACEHCLDFFMYFVVLNLATSQSQGGFLGNFFPSIVPLFREPTLEKEIDGRFTCHKQNVIDPSYRHSGIHSYAAT